MNDIIKYIIEHKDWIFLGVGVAFIGVAYKSIRHILTSKDKKSTNPLQNNNGIYNGRISGRQNTINNTINFNSPINKIDISNDMLREANGLYEKKIIKKL